MIRPVPYAFSRLIGAAIVLGAASAHAQEAPPGSTPPSSPAATVTAPAPAPMQPMPYPPPAPLGFYQREIMFDATSPDATLEVEQGGQWRSVCRGHCRTIAPIGAKFHVSGEGVSTSKAFTVSPSPNPVVLHADAGSSSGRSTGLVLTSVGGATMIVGIVIVSLSSVCVLCSGAEKSERRADAVKTGVPILAIGAGALAGGIVLMISNRTRLDFAPGAAAWSPRVKLGKGFEATPEGIAF